MSNIALVAEDTGNSAATNTKTHLEFLGHTVALFSATDLSSPALFSSYDLLVMTRLSRSNYIANGNAIRNLLTVKPMLIGMLAVNGTGGATLDHPVNQASLAGGIEPPVSGLGSLTVLNNSHPITAGYSVGQVLSIQSSGSFYTGLDETATTSFVGENLASVTATGRGGLLAMDRGEQTLDGLITLSERVVISDHIYGSTAYGTDAPALTQSIIDWLLEPPVDEITYGQKWPGYGSSGSGTPGLSAYQIAVLEGFVGTEAEWLATLVGATGAAGADGAAGAPGADGAPGPAGPAGPTGEATMPARTTAVYTTGSLANSASETGNVVMATAYRIFRISLDEPARVRVYATEAQRTADAARPIGTDPTGNHGLLLEFVGTGAILSATLTPFVDGASMETVPSSNIPIAVTNLSGATDTIQVTFTYVRTE